MQIRRLKYNLIKPFAAIYRRHYDIQNEIVHQAHYKVNAKPNWNAKKQGFLSERVHAKLCYLKGRKVQTVYSRSKFIQNWLFSSTVRE